LNNPELTAQRFVETRDGRFYRTGDLGRWTEDGRLELAGRIDDQIKFHGQRMELGEIEQALRSHSSVGEAVILLEAATQETRILRAFVRLRSGTAPPSQDEWREYLSGALPMYMVPASVTSVASIPLTFAGKTDRDALLAVQRACDTSATKTPPRGEMEMRIAALWCELLKTEVAHGISRGISGDDNFFALGGNSLLAVTMTHRLSRELDRPVPARELFAAPTLAGFARRVELLSNVSTPAPLSSDLATEGQCEFWVAQTAGLDTRSFTIPLLCAVEGAIQSQDLLNQDLWNKAWATLVARHEALRTSFHEDKEGRLRRAVVPALTAQLETATQPDLAAARAFVRQRQNGPFAMGTPPLWRAGLIDVSNSGELLFWLALHHSIGDGQSLGIIVEELGALLRGEELPELASNFGESAQREEDYLAGPACAADARYWRDLLLRQPDHAFAEAPLDFARSLAAKPGNHRFEARLDAATSEGLRALARQHEASLHALMLTLLALEARRRMGRDHIVIGATASSRETAAEGDVIGYYVNMLPIAFHLPRDIGFGAALRETQKSLAAGLQHARYPFARMYRDFWAEHPQHRNPARYPLFDLAVTENPESRTSASASSASLHLAPISGLAYELTSASPGEDMVLIHQTSADGSLLLQWHVNAALFADETARSWFEALRGWAEWLAQDQDKVRERAQQPLPALLPHEASLLEVWEQGSKVARPALRLHELFERSLDSDATQGNRPAIITQSGTTTYAALEHESNVIAHCLLLQGVVPGAVVGVITGRSASLPAAVLGIWKAGATYLPLAADLPHERLAFMARDAGMAHLIALDGLAVPPALPPAMRPEELGVEFRCTHGHRPPKSGGGSEVAYIIYTSGSTGQPKGVRIGHDAYVNSVLGAGEAIGLTREDRSLMFASPSFDVSLSDIGLPLAFGAALCPVPYEIISSPSRFRAFLAQFEVTVADLTPSYLRLFEGATLPSLRVLVTGGEAPFPADVETYAGRLAYFNAYGPTENAITTMLGRLRPGSHGFLSGGRPLPNTSVHICHAEGNTVAPGVIGELWLGGNGLALDYVGRPDLTAAAFVKTAGGRLYRSGDLGRWHSTGEIEILGRIDDQVKLHGIRVELGEIEQVLSRHTDIAQAAALVDRDAEGNHKLWAFVRPVQGMESPTEDGWREYLADRLPAYMIPSAVIAVDEIPLSTSGKVDKATLMAQLAGRSSLAGLKLAGESEPQPGLEAQIARLWTDMLGRESIGRDDNFFALGGHSLLAIAVAYRLEQMLGYPVPARELFAEPTLRGFARRVSRLSESVPQDEEVSSDRATEGQREFWVAEKAGLDTRGFSIPLILLPRGKVSSAEQWRSAWDELVSRHDALRACFQEDCNGVLRCSVLPEFSGDFEISTQHELPTALAHIRERQALPFIMESPPLWRAGLVHVLATDQHLFWLVLHHSVGDGVSLGVLADELSTLLEGGTLLPVAGHFDQSAGREERYLGGRACGEDALYWKATLASLGDAASETPHPFDEWSLDFPRPLGHTAANIKGAHSFRVGLDAGVAAGLRNFAQRNGASLHALMLTIMALEVRRRTGRPNFFLGTATSTRDSVREARIIGYYVNLLPLPCRVRRTESVEEALRTTQRNLAAALQHARYPFARMYSDFREGSSVTPHPARYPLCDMAVTENPGPALTNFTSIAQPTGYELRRNAPAQDMVLVHEGQADGSLTLQWYVNAAIYEKETAEAWINSLAEWARFLANGERLADSPLPDLLPEEKKLLSAWEPGPVVPHPAQSFPARFEQWARSQPDRPAVVSEQARQTYAELDARSNALAHALLAPGLAREEVIGVLTGRSVALPETVLAIWKAGGCYLPLVADLPAERLAFIARDARIRTLVVLDGLEPPPALAGMGCQIFRPESLQETYLSSHSQTIEIGGGGVRGSELAYIIYTSGSTGEPKGVMLRHQGLNNLALGIATALDMRSDDRASIMASPGFDAWISELVMAWAVGAAVVPVLRDEMDDIQELRAKFVRLGVTVATMPPSYLRLFEQADFPTLRLLLTAGEPPHRADALHYASRLRYINGYGPTENTVAVSYGEVMAAAQQQRLTAGTPLPNTSVHILGCEGESVPPGAIGMIWLGGQQLASGYLNRPDLTAASFVETPAGRLYCTGDLGRWTHTGELEVLGRSDGQVKLRGQRVELGEIEYRLGSYPGVRQAVAVVEGATGDTQILRAFVSFHSGLSEPTQAEWRDYLSATLPSYMLPSAVIRVSAIPVNSAGKVNRGALLSAVSEWSAFLEDNGRRKRTAPREGLEQHIAQVWEEQLEHPVDDRRVIAREDNFFDLGGNSLRAIAVVNDLRRTLQCTVNDLYEHPSLAEFASVCRERPEHLRALIQSAAQHWQSYRKGLAAYETERGSALTIAQRDYQTRSQAYWQSGTQGHRDYRRVLLTGATGYLGSYLLRELLDDSNRQVSVLVRGEDGRSEDGHTARARLGEILCHYFGHEKGAALRDNPRLTVLAGDLRRGDLGLSTHDRDRLADGLQAIFHSAANVKHFGHYSEFHADNVAATARLLKLASNHAATPADFHFVSTLSVCGKAPEAGFRLFTEYDGVPEVLDDNYYVRSKQGAERLVVAARENLANACIHRVGSLVFAADGGPLQFNIRENALFRQIAAFLRLGVVPDDSHLWLCHVDLVARGLVLLANAADLTNEMHHLENVRRDSLGAFVGAGDRVEICDFDAFLKRLESAVGEPDMSAALAETMENLGLYRGLSPQGRARRLEILSDRTQMLLARLGLVWPPLPEAGQKEMLRHAARLFSPHPRPEAAVPTSHFNQIPAISQQGALIMDTLTMNPPASLSAVVNPVLSLVPSAKLRDTLRRAFSEEHMAIASIEECFRVFPSAAWSKDLLYTFASSWKATHLKMLAIYGLSCRLQRTADVAGELDRFNLYIAAARNASTSHEDLGLDFDGHTHAELYEDFADALTGGDLWQLSKYRLPEAHQFSQWIYRNMVVEAIPVGLLTNMFSEIYNHGEYSIALPAANSYFQQHTRLTASERRKAVTYIAAHVEDEVEATHFLIVVEALDRYSAASKTHFDSERAGLVFRTYLRKLALVMRRLTEMMRTELASGAAQTLSASDVA